MELLKKYFPEPLLDDITSNNSIPIIGSGFSLNANIPKSKKMLMWEGLAKEIASRIPDYNYHNAIDAISAYSHEFKRVKLIELLRELLIIDDLVPGESHKEFAKLPFNLICTTNFDHLLEDSYNKCVPIIDETQLAINTNRNSVKLLKLHGDLNHPERLVATEEDYDLFIDNYPLIATFLANLLITKTPLFIGYSIDDPDFRQIWKIIVDRLGRSARPAYTIKLLSLIHI